MPSVVPPHEVLYQNQLAPVPGLPPEMPMVTGFPGQITGADAVAESGRIELKSVTIVMLEQEVVLQMPSALT